MRNTNVGFYSIAVLVVLATIPVSICNADTVVLKDNMKVKGVVVEEFQDRVILSTYEGEKEFMKNNVRRIIYDLEEQNFTSLGDYYQDKKMYSKAYYFYNKALAVNPEYERAKDGLTYVSSFVQQKSRLSKLDHIRRLNEEKSWGQSDTKKTETSDQDKVKEKLGLVLKNKNGRYIVSNVIFSSPAYRAGVKENDVILAAWGRNLSYMERDEVYAKFATTGVMDINLVILRAVSVLLKDRSGDYTAVSGLVFSVSEMEGLVVSKVVKDSPADIAGIEKGDAIKSVEGESTRYMSLKTLEDMINNSNGNDFVFGVQKKITIWKKFEV